MSKFFINRPIVAMVVAILMVLVGAVTIASLPVAQFPSIAPPQVSITVTYPGASSQSVQDTVIQPILQQMSGLDGLEYIASSTQAATSVPIPSQLTAISGRMLAGRRKVNAPPRYI